MKSLKKKAFLKGFILLLSLAFLHSSEVSEVDGQPYSAPLWNYETKDKVISVAISSNGNYVAAGSWDYNVYFFLSFPSQVIPFWSENEITGSFEGTYEVAFEVVCWPDQAHLKISVSYFMTVASTYTIQVQIFDSAESLVASRNLTIMSTSQYIQTEYARTTIKVESPGNYTIKFLPESDTRTINFGIMQSGYDSNPPTISNICYEPQNATSEDEVTVTALVTDDLAGVKAVLLWYSIDSGNTWNQIQMTNTNMTLYTAIIPKQEEGTTVQFKITAEDVLGFTAESSIMSYIPAAPLSSSSSSTASWTFPIFLAVAFVIVPIRRLKRRKPR
jgi:hypothetical protein